MRTHNIGFYEDLTKSSFNYHQICTLSHLLRYGTIKELIRLCGCVGWSAPLLFAYVKADVLKVQLI